MMNLAIFAIAFNIEKMRRKTLIINKKTTKSPKQDNFFAFILFFYSLYRENC